MVLLKVPALISFMPFPGRESNTFKSEVEVSRILIALSVAERSANCLLWMQASMKSSAFRQKLSLHEEGVSILGDSNGLKSLMSLPDLLSSLKRLFDLIPSRLPSPANRKKSVPPGISN